MPPTIPISEIVDALQRVDGQDDATPDRAFADRLHFFAHASREVSSIVVDLVREQRALRRGADAEIVTLDTAAGEASGRRWASRPSTTRSRTEPSSVRHSRVAEGAGRCSSRSSAIDAHPSRVPG